MTLGVFGLSVVSFAQETINGPDDLAKTASWKIADDGAIRSAFEDWLHEANIGDESKTRVREFLQQEAKPDPPGHVIDWVMDVMVIARPDVNQVREQLKRQRSSATPPDFSVLLENPDEKNFVRDHVRLYFARWLAQNEFYDEALAQFSNLDLATNLDPASLLFYRSLVEHQLLKKEDCLKSINLLLENASELPRRYTSLAKLMLADLEPLEADSLDEITRMMNDIRRRTGLNRSGKHVLGEEEKVIEKLDKLIENLEAQRQAQQASSNTKPGSPMEDSFQAGGQGTGDVTSKRLPEGGDWGDLPPADRAAALAEMAKDMPPHYRAVIEEYFRRLAKENERR